MPRSAVSRSGGGGGGGGGSDASWPIGASTSEDRSRSTSENIGTVTASRILPSTPAESTSSPRSYGPGGTLNCNRPLPATRSGTPLEFQSTTAAESLLAL